MFKIIICLLIVTQILAQEDNKTYKEDEIDITTVNPKDSHKVDEKTVLEYDNKDVVKDLPKEVPNNDNPKPDIKEKDELPNNPYGKLPDNYDTDNKNEKPVESNPGFDSKGEEVEEKITKKVEKPLSFDRDIDLGKDYKKVELKPKNYEKEVPFGSYDPKTGVDGPQKNQNAYGDEDKLPEQGGGDEVEYGSEQEKGGPPQGFHNKQKEVQIANEIIDKLLKLVKSDYRSDFEQVKLEEFEPFKNGRWGTVKLHSGVVTGLSNAERAGNVVVVDEYGNKKLIISDIAVKEVVADYKMNAKLFNRISFKDRDLKLLLKKAIINIKLEVDKSQKKLSVQEINLKTFEGLSLKSGRLFWPFNKLTDVIVKTQEKRIRELIKNEFNKYMGKVVHSIQFDEMFAKF